MDIKTLEAAASVHPGVLGLLNRDLVDPTPTDVAAALQRITGKTFEARLPRENAAEYMVEDVKIMTAVAGALAARNGELSATLEEVNEQLLTEREESRQFDWDQLTEERDHAVARLASLEVVLRCWELFPARRKGTAAAEIRTAIAQTGSTDKAGR